MAWESGIKVKAKGEYAENAGIAGLIGTIYSLSGRTDKGDIKGAVINFPNHKTEDYYEFLYKDEFEKAECFKSKDIQ